MMTEQQILGLQEEFNALCDERLTDPSYERCTEIRDRQAEIMEIMRNVARLGTVDLVSRSELEARIAELEDELERARQHGLGVQLRGHKFTVVVNDVLAELNSAMKKYAPMPTAHDGYAVILEELDELWEEVKAKGKIRSQSRMHDEAKQVAAMALRFMIDVCGEKAGTAG